jgi:hypothetical protein
MQDYNFPVILYGCETWSLSLREEHWLRVFKNTAVRKVLCVMRIFLVLLPLNITGTTKSTTLKSVAHVAHGEKK